MTAADIVQRRLIAQQIAATSCTQPHEVVGWMGAMQAQDYLGSLWAVGARLPGTTERTMEAAIADGSVVRTWPMRGTIHLLAAADVRSWVGLLAPRLMQHYRKRMTELELEAPVLAASADVLVRALEGGKRLTRPELHAVLNEAGIATDGQRGNHILGHLSMMLHLCIGPRVGKQPTFVLLDEWVPPTPQPSREEALAAVALRFFKSHGPATRDDLVHWTFMTVSDAKAAIASVAGELRHEQIDGTDYWSDPDLPDVTPDPARAFLLPPFDEWLVSYRDRTATISAENFKKVVPGLNGVYFPIVVIGGQVVGIWKRTLKRKEVVITFTPLGRWTPAQHDAFLAAAEEYATFLGLPLVVDTAGVQ